MDGRITKSTELLRKASNMLLESQGTVSSGGRYPGRPTVKTWATQEPQCYFQRVNFTPVLE